MMKTAKHDRIQQQIVSACKELGIPAKQEYKGNGWRADVFVPNAVRPVAFEIQLSAQSLSRTLERQAKYVRDGIVGCWLFEKPLPKLVAERVDLPVFYVEERGETNFIVSLADRRKMELQDFLKSFIAGCIQFKTFAKPKEIQKVGLVFYEMTCWKCKKLNHLFFVDTPFYTACNAIIKPGEFLWDSSAVEYRPEIIELARKLIGDNPDPDLKLGEIKPRFSNTVGESYTSFGCYSCDSIFGDFYVMDAKIDVMSGPKELCFHGEIKLLEPDRLDLPHWCFPDEKQYCYEYEESID